MKNFFNRVPSSDSVHLSFLLSIYEVEHRAGEAVEPDHSLSFEFHLLSRVCIIKAQHHHKPLPIFGRGSSDFNVAYLQFSHPSLPTQSLLPHGGTGILQSHLCKMDVASTAPTTADV